MNNEELIKLAIEESRANLENNYTKGGPFGAVIVKNGEIIASAHNTVIESIDATAHAEVNAIRLASQKLKTHDLRGCILYTSAEPCPMCLSAIIWANIKEVYYANTKKDVAEDAGKGAVIGLISAGFKALGLKGGKGFIIREALDADKKALGAVSKGFLLTAKLKA